MMNTLQSKHKQPNR